jgi:hypothetical protein
VNQKAQRRPSGTKAGAESQGGDNVAPTLAETADDSLHVALARARKEHPGGRREVREMYRSARWHWHWRRQYGEQFDAMKLGRATASVDLLPKRRHPDALEVSERLRKRVVA